MVLTPELNKIRSFNWLKPQKYTALQQVEIDILICNHIWITRDRTQVSIKDMSTSHIQNCIKCFNGEGFTYIPDTYLGGKDKWIKIFNEELTKRQ